MRAANACAASYTAGMDHIGGRLREIERNIEIIGADPITQHGFTQVPNLILNDKNVSVGGKLTYAMLLKYAWSDAGCFPGQQRLADDMGAGERSVRTYLKELEALGYLKIEQRGLGRTNYYRLSVTVDKRA